LRPDGSARTFMVLPISNVAGISESMIRQEARIKAEADKKARERGEEPADSPAVRGFSQMLGLKLRFKDGTELTTHHLIVLASDRFGEAWDLIPHEGFHGLVKEALTARQYSKLLNFLGLPEEPGAKLFGVRMAERAKELENRSEFQRIWDEVRKFVRQTIQSFVGGPNAPADSQEILSRIFAGEFFQGPKSSQVVQGEKLAVTQSTPEGAATQDQQKSAAAEQLAHNLSIDNPGMAKEIENQMGDLPDRDEGTGPLQFKVIDLYGNVKIVDVPDVPGMTMAKAHQQITKGEDVARAEYVGKGAVRRHPEDSRRPHLLTDDEVRVRVARQRLRLELPDYQKLSIEVGPETRRSRTNPELAKLIPPSRRYTPPPVKRNTPSPADFDPDRPGPGIVALFKTPEEFQKISERVFNEVKDMTLPGNTATGRDQYDAAVNQVYADGRKDKKTYNFRPPPIHVWDKALGLEDKYRYWYERYVETFARRFVNFDDKMISVWSEHLPFSQSTFRESSLSLPT
jgi:hypothetical protein